MYLAQQDCMRELPYVIHLLERLPYNAALALAAVHLCRDLVRSHYVLRQQRQHQKTPASAAASGATSADVPATSVDTLVQMGFGREEALSMLVRADGSLQRATELLLAGVPARLAAPAAGAALPQQAVERAADESMETNDDDELQQAIALSLEADDVETARDGTQNTDTAPGSIFTFLFAIVRSMLEVADTDMKKKEQKRLEAAKPLDDSKLCEFLQNTVIPLCLTDAANALRVHEVLRSLIFPNSVKINCRKRRRAAAPTRCSSLRRRSSRRSRSTT